MSDLTSSGASTLPRSFRYHPEDLPKTPEPSSVNDLELPSPPQQPVRSTRLKIRRRNGSSIHQPTDTFLASVDAADIPMPSIEIPQLALPQFCDDQNMLDRDIITMTPGYLSPRPPRYEAASPPRTPAPELQRPEAASRPNWSRGANSPSKRPDSARSYDSDASDASFFSAGQISRPSDDGSCTSPESDITDPFSPFSTLSKGRGVARSLARMFAQPTPAPAAAARKCVPWSVDMSRHLWATYQLYLQDPTVTPFCISASGIPPEGICHRVAREAKRTWKGQKSTRSSRRTAHLLTTFAGASRANSSDQSGSLTPTAVDASHAYPQWPHAGAVTRSHLRDLCKQRNSNLGHERRGLYRETRSPTPFTSMNTRNQMRGSPTPARPEAFRAKAFCTKDIRVSLATSTAESMQPDGPLASLAADVDERSFDFNDLTPAVNVPAMRETPQMGPSLHAGLGSPFRSPLVVSPMETPSRAPGHPHSYGPSSSRSLQVASNPATSAATSRGDTLFTTTGHALQSAAQISEPRSLNGTQKRRAQDALVEDLMHHGSVSPTLPDRAEIENPGRLSHRRVRTRGLSLGDDVFPNRIQSLFTNPPLGHASPASSTTSSRYDEALDHPASAGPSQLSATPQLLPPADINPFGAASDHDGSNTFPRRFHGEGRTPIRRTGFATMHQTRRSIESFDFTDPSFRVKHVEQRLQQLQEQRELRDAAQNARLSKDSNLN